MAVIQIESIHQRLDGLDGWRLLAFGIMALERALPNFLQFEREANFAGFGVLSAALAKAWLTLERDSMVSRIGIGSEDCDGVAPEPEGHTSNYVSAALDAANIAANLLEFIRTNDRDRIIEIADLRRDTIDIYVQMACRIDPQQSDFEDTILRHPLMQKELSDQMSDLDFLANCKNEGEVAGQVAGRVNAMGYRRFSLL